MQRAKEEAELHMQHAKEEAELHMQRAKEEANARISELERIADEVKQKAEKEAELHMQRAKEEANTRISELERIADEVKQKAEKEAELQMQRAKEEADARISELERIADEVKEKAEKAAWELKAAQARAVEAQEKSARDLVTRAQEMIEAREENLRLKQLLSASMRATDLTAKVDIFWSSNLLSLYGGPWKIKSPMLLSPLNLGIVRHNFYWQNFKGEFVCFWQGLWVHPLFHSAIRHIDPFILYCLTFEKLSQVAFLSKI